LKKEVRILTYKTVECGLMKYTFYAVLRGVKGFEHVGVVKGGLEELIKYLKSSKVYDEVRIMYEVEELINHAEHKGVVKYALFMNSLVNEMLKYLC